MKTNYNYELIKDYLDSILDAKTSKEIEELITNDETARTIAKGIVQMQNHFKEDEDIDAYLEEVLNKNRTLIEKKSRSSNIGLLLRIAASVLLVVVSGILIYRLSQSTLTDLVSQALAQPYEISITQRNSETGSTIENAAFHYSQGNYQKAIQLLENQTSSRAVFYRGLSLLYSDEYIQAIDELNKNELKESRFAEQAKWYLAVGLIKAGQHENAKKVLEEIVSQDQHFKKDLSVKLLEKLNED